MSVLGALADRLLRRHAAQPHEVTQPLLDAAELASLAALARLWPLAMRQVDVHEREEAKYDGNDREKVEPEGVLGDRSKGPVLCKDVSEASVNKI